MSPGSSRLILGGQKSGKSRAAERLAGHWLAAKPGRRVTLIATATAGDAEMAERIERHRRDRAVHALGLDVVEAPVDLVGTLRSLAAPDHLLLVDCLTLWLTNLMMPAQGDALSTEALEAEMAALEKVVADNQGAVVLVSNEIGWGVVPMGREVRAFVDTMGLLNQRMARVCSDVKWVVAGHSIDLKEI